MNDNIEGFPEDRYYQNLYDLENVTGTEDIPPFGIRCIIREPILIRGAQTRVMSGDYKLLLGIRNESSYYSSECIVSGKAKSSSANRTLEEQITDLIPQLKEGCGQVCFLDPLIVENASFYIGGAGRPLILLGSMNSNS